MVRITSFVCEGCQANGKIMSSEQIERLLEVLKQLGYQGTISFDSFRFPNFKVVADCLCWLVHRYDPLVELDMDLSLEEGRIMFLKSAAQVMRSKARVDLDLRSLYSADGEAVNELLKIASLLEQANHTLSKHEIENYEALPSLKTFELKATRSLLLDIINVGGQLYDELAAEVQLQELRTIAASKCTDIEEVEDFIRNSTNAATVDISLIGKEKVSREKEERALQAIYEKRKEELDTENKRLAMLKNVRPAYMDEFEALQKDLQKLFAVYFEKFHNLQWLEKELQSYRKEEQEEIEESAVSLKQLQQRVHDENLAILRGGVVDDSSEDGITPCEIPERNAIMFDEQRRNWFPKGLLEATHLDMSFSKRIHKKSDLEGTLESEGDIGVENDLTNVNSDDDF